MILETVYFILNSLGMNLTDKSINRFVKFLKEKFGKNVIEAWCMTIDSVAKQSPEKEKKILLELHDESFVLETSMTRINEKYLRGILISKGLTRQTSDLLILRLKIFFRNNLIEILATNEELYRKYSAEILSSLGENLSESFRTISIEIEQLKKIQIETLHEMKIKQTAFSLEPKHYEYINGIKEIFIKNKNGDARINRKWTIINESKGIMRKLILDMQHEGKLEIPLCKINGTEITPRVKTVKFDSTFDDDVHRHNLRHSTRVTINLEKFNIVTHSQFEIEMIREHEGTFPEMFYKEFSNIFVARPTKGIYIIIHAPSSVRFSSSGIDFEVNDDVGNKDDVEVKRLKSGFQPILINNSTSIIWTVPYPIRGYNYTLKFKVEE